MDMGGLVIVEEDDDAHAMGAMDRDHGVEQL
jgi:hypothetical protein